LFQNSQAVITEGAVLMSVADNKMISWG